MRSPSVRDGGPLGFRDGILCLSDGATSGLQGGPICCEASAVIGFWDSLRLLPGSRRTQWEGRRRLPTQRHDFPACSAPRVLLPPPTGAGSESSTGSHSPAGGPQGDGAGPATWLVGSAQRAGVGPGEGGGARLPSLWAQGPDAGFDEPPPRNPSRPPHPACRAPGRKWAGPPPSHPSSAGGRGDLLSACPEAPQRAPPSWPGPSRSPRRPSGLRSPNNTRRRRQWLRSGRCPRASTPGHSLGQPSELRGRGTSLSPRQEH